MISGAVAAATWFESLAVAQFYPKPGRRRERRASVAAASAEMKFFCCTALAEAFCTRSRRPRSLSESSVTGVDASGYNCLPHAPRQNRSML